VRRDSLCNAVLSRLVEQQPCSHLSLSPHVIEVKIINCTGSCACKILFMLHTGPGRAQAPPTKGCHIYHCAHFRQLSSISSARCALLSHMLVVKRNVGALETHAFHIVSRQKLTVDRKRHHKLVLPLYLGLDISNNLSRALSCLCLSGHNVLVQRMRHNRIT